MYTWHFCELCYIRCSCTKVFDFIFRHDDPNDSLRNYENECYCLEGEGFQCLPSGVMNLEPCYRKDDAPLAISFPHFYQADPKLLERVEGLNPEKSKHEFYMDVEPQSGRPLAMQNRYQLNVVISGKYYLFTYLHNT